MKLSQNISLIDSFVLSWNFLLINLMFSLAMFEYYIVTKGKLLFEFAGLFAGPCNFVFKGCVRYIFFSLFSV